MTVVVLDTNVISELMRPQPDQWVLAWANNLNPEGAATDALVADQSLDHPMSDHPVKSRKKLIEVAIPL
ncbi:hypothetical protein SynWH8101_1258 [Synechococcus sp. WH 8101]|nr:hypothetical protein SynWH8101_1258 [Synechococcus sp. WH 8101]QNI45070.1 hypothetical protein SynRCC2555_01287 [Synechococcus sp. WH 8101]